jgi:guanylate kinase
MSCHIVFSGGFCVGKTTIMNKITEEFGIDKVPDHTTRAPRPGESEGKPYNFITREQFEQNKASGLYFDTFSHKDNHYGVPIEPLKTRAKWLMDIVSSAWPKFKQEFPDAIGIYLDVPSSEAELIRRARERGNTEDVIKDRLALLKDEKREGFHYYLPGDMPLVEKIERVRAIVRERLGRKE